MIDRLFVYGTLRRGQRAHDLLAPHVATAVDATAIGTLYAFETYPALLEAGDTVIVGDLVTLRDPEGAFARLDAYEGDEYRRALVEIHADGEVGTAWCYLLAGVAPDPADACVVRSGDWAEHVQDMK